MRRKLHGFIRALLAACIGLLLPLQVAGRAEATPVTVTNGIQFTDTAGHVVHAHDGGMIKVGQYYYWFGENPYPNNHFRYISVYRSTDLHSWQFRNNVLTEASSPELRAADASLWRPKVIYNAHTKQYVMWMRKGNKPNAKDSLKGRVAVAMSRTVDGTYTYKGSFRPLGIKSYDMTAFRDDDGTAYLISTTTDQKDLTIFRLTPDYLQVAAKVATLRGVEREGAAMFKRNGVYFLVASGVTGWYPNQAQYATATRVTGPWSKMADYGDSIAYGSQSSSVLAVQGNTTTSYLYLGDRHARTWGPSVRDSEYVWLPLQFPSGRTLSMPWYPQVSIDTATGVVHGVGSGHAYEELRARHSGMCLTVPAASKTNGVWVKQQTCGTAADPDQHWQVLRLGNGYYRLIVRHSHKCLTVPWRSTARGLPATQETCGTGTNQQWKFTSAEAGYHQLASGRSGLCLTIPNASTTSGARAVQDTCGHRPDQQWRLVGAPYANAAEPVARAASWSGAWTAAQEEVCPSSPVQASHGFDKQSVRQVVRLSTGGDYVRIRLSNLYGRTPLPLTGATVARAAAGAAVQRGSQRHLTFNHRQAVRIPRGGELRSDALLIRTSPLEKLTVTLYFAEATGPATYHKRAMATSYVAAGDHRADPASWAFTRTSESWYYLTGVDVLDHQGQQRKGVVTLGDSITDGYGSTMNANHRYPNWLAERLLRSGRPRPVLNAGISGNEVRRDTPCYGDAAVNRFQRDVASQPGVRTVIVLEGVNDINRSGKNGAPRITAGDLIRSYQKLIRQARAKGLQVIGGTILPCPCGAPAEAMRNEVNSWIRHSAGTSSGYDAIVDFDRALADPSNAHAMRRAYDSGDHLHPNDAGYRAMAQAIDISRL